MFTRVNRIDLRLLSYFCHEIVNQSKDEVLIFINHCFLWN